MRACTVLPTPHGLVPVPPAASQACFRRHCRWNFFFLGAVRTLAALPGGHSLPGLLETLQGSALPPMVRRARHSLPCIDPMPLSKRRAVR